MVAAPLDQLAKSKDSPLRFQPVDQAERQKLGQHGQEVQTIPRGAAKAGNRSGGYAQPRSLPRNSSRPE